MGSKFVEKHKRKSVLAALLFIFQGRAKYVGILLIVTVLSVPFVISSETLSGIMNFAPVSAFLNRVGLGSLVSAINPKYSNDVLRAALDKAAEDSAQNSFWSKFLKSVNATMPPAGSQNSIAMIRGGGDLFGPVELKDDKGKKGPGQVKGVVNETERSRGETGEDVNLEGMLGNVAGGGGLYGDQLGQGLSGRFGEGAASGSGPYMNRTTFGGPGGASAKGSGMYASVMEQVGSKVPVPGAPTRVSVKKLGRVSGFSWKNVGYKTSGAKVDIKLSSKRSMFQLAETFSMSGSAFKSKDSAYEYQASYVGSTYDGNDVNADVIQTGADTAPSVPDTSFAGDLLSGAQDLQNMAKECTDAEGTNGAKMSDDAKQIKTITESLGKPPKCCSHGAVDTWNGKLQRASALCEDMNVNGTILAQKCQSAQKKMDCGEIRSKQISKCSKFKCFLAFLFMLLIGGLLGLAGMIIMGSMLAGINLFGGKATEFVIGIMNKIAGGD